MIGDRILELLKTRIVDRDEFVKRLSLGGYPTLTIENIIDNMLEDGDLIHYGANQIGTPPELD